MENHDPNFDCPAYMKELEDSRSAPCSAPVERDEDELKEAFHHLWTLAVGNPNYDKADWKNLRDQLAEKGVEL